MRFWIRVRCCNLIAYSLNRYSLWVFQGTGVRGLPQSGPERYGTGMSAEPARTQIAHVHVFGHPTLPLDVAAVPADAQVFNAHNLCLLLARAGVPFTY